jgi:hypothetical protein
MLIDTRREPPPPTDPDGSRHWRWDGWRWFMPLCVGVVLMVLSAVFPPFPAYILILGACVMFVRGLTRVVQNTPGLRDYHQ